MEKLFYLSTILNWLGAMYLLFTGMKLLARQHSPDSNVVVLLLTGLVLIALSLVSFMLYQNSYKAAATWIGWIPWIVIIFSGGAFLMLTAGAKWN